MYDRIPNGIDVIFRVDPRISRRGSTSMEKSMISGKTYHIIETKTVGDQRRWTIKGTFGYKNVQLSVSEFTISNILYLLPIKFIVVK